MTTYDEIIRMQNSTVTSYSQESFLENIDMKRLSGSDFANLKEMISGNLSLTNFYDITEEMWNAISIIFNDLKVDVFVDEQEGTNWICEHGAAKFCKPDYTICFDRQSGPRLPHQYSLMITKTNPNYYFFSRPEYQVLFDCFKLKVFLPSWNDDVKLSGCLRKAIFDTYRVDIGDQSTMEGISPLKIAQIQEVDDYYRSNDYNPSFIVTNINNDIVRSMNRNSLLKINAHIQPYQKFNFIDGLHVVVSMKDLIKGLTIENSSYSNVNWQGLINEQELWNCQCQMRGDFFFRKHFRCHFVDGQFKCPGCCEDEEHWKPMESDEISVETSKAIDSAVVSNEMVNLALTLDSIDSVSKFVDVKLKKMEDLHWITVDSKIEPHLPMDDHNVEMVLVETINLTKRLVKIKESTELLMKEMHWSHAYEDIEMIHDCSSVAADMLSEYFLKIFRLNRRSSLDNIEFLKFRYRNSKIDIKRPASGSEHSKLCDNVWYLISRNLDTRSVFNLAKTCRSLYWTPVCSCCSKMICDKEVEHLAMNMDIERDEAEYGFYDM